MVAHVTVSFLKLLIYVSLASLNKIEFETQDFENYKSISFTLYSKGKYFITRHCKNYKMQKRVSS